MSFKLHIITLCCLALASYIQSYNLSGHHKLSDWKNDQDYYISNSNVTILGANKPCHNKIKHYDGYTTTGQLVYPNRLRFASVPSHCFSFKVKSNNQTHIGLFSNNYAPKTHPWVEIVIGGIPNGLGNIIRKDGTDIHATYNQRQNSLNKDEYRGFWVSWVAGHYQVGYRGQQPFITWDDPVPFPIVSVGVDTCCGTIGHVVAEEPRCPGVNM